VITLADAVSGIAAASMKVNSVAVFMMCSPLRIRGCNDVAAISAAIFEVFGCNLCVQRIQRRECGKPETGHIERVVISGATACPSFGCRSLKRSEKGLKFL
jgi:hypothetical protein